MAPAGIGRERRRGRAPLRSAAQPRRQVGEVSSHCPRPLERPPQERRPRPELEFLYARNSILEALRANRRRARYLAVAKGVQVSGTLAEILDLARARGLAAREVERRQLDELVPSHQGVALESSPYPYADDDEIYDRIGAGGLYLLLDCLEDPQNLGTLLRTADAVGVAGVLMPEHRAAGVTPAVSASSAGAVEHLLVARVGNLVHAMEVLKERGVWLVGLEDVPEARPFDSVDWRGSLALVVGSEGRGMRRLVRERCDYVVRLPMAGHVGSLNVSVAGSIALYHAWRQRSTEDAGLGAG
ncbi:MAG: 23S rRNA (guanosine(2251)-2'-O)-methyltransferase RlmB [Anaerolineae bacterium]